MPSLDNAAREDARIHAGAPPAPPLNSAAPTGPQRVDLAPVRRLIRGDAALRGTARAQELHPNAIDPKYVALRKYNRYEHRAHRRIKEISSRR
jgi:hypothetical protein